MAITPAMEALIADGDAADPIAAQRRPDARELITTADELSAMLAQPTYVLDIPGDHGKAALAGPNLRETEAGYEVRDLNGVWRRYPRDGA